MRRFLAPISITFFHRIWCQVSSDCYGVTLSYSLTVFRSPFQRSTNYVKCLVAIDQPQDSKSTTHSSLIYWTWFLMSPISPASSSSMFSVTSCDALSLLRLDFSSLMMSSISSFSADDIRQLSLEWQKDETEMQLLGKKNCLKHRANINNVCNKMFLLERFILYLFWKQFLPWHL